MNNGKDINSKKSSLQEAKANFEEIQNFAKQEAKKELEIELSKKVDSLLKESIEIDVNKTEDGSEDVIVNDNTEEFTDAEEIEVSDEANLEELDEMITLEQEDQITPASGAPDAAPVAPDAAPAVSVDAEIAEEAPEGDVEAIASELTKNLVALIKASTDTTEEVDVIDDEAEDFTETPEAPASEAPAPEAPASEITPAPLAEENEILEFTLDEIEEIELDEGLFGGGLDLTTKFKAIIKYYLDHKSNKSVTSWLNAVAKKGIEGIKNNIETQFERLKPGLGGSVAGTGVSSAGAPDILNQIKSNKHVFDSAISNILAQIVGDNSEIVSKQLQLQASPINEDEDEFSFEFNADNSDNVEDEEMIFEIEDEEFDDDNFEKNPDAEFELTGAADDISLELDDNNEIDFSADTDFIPNLDEEDIIEALGQSEMVKHSTYNKVPNDDYRTSRSINENKTNKNKVHNESKIDELIKENARLKSETKSMNNIIKEYKSSFVGLRKQFDEMQTFNARLAYANSIFAQSGYSTSEKIQIAERFDKTKTVEESKALFDSIVKEGKNTSKNISFDKIKSTATKTAKLVETQKPLYESAEMKRNKYLAGIRKNEE